LRCIYNKGSRNFLCKRKHFGFLKMNLKCSFFTSNVNASFPCLRCSDFIDKQCVRFLYTKTVNSHSTLTQFTTSTWRPHIILIKHHLAVSWFIYILSIKHALTPPCKPPARMISIHSRNLGYKSKTRTSYWVLLAAFV
jgi:hypothetical protein